MIASETKRDSKSGWQHPLLALNEEELDLVLQLVLASGSLKDLARGYQVSYPTIRLRVDRLIGDEDSEQGPSSDDHAADG